MEHVPDITLTERLKQGDPGAYDELFLKYYKLLCISAYFIVKNDEEAGDIVQSLFLDIYEKKIYLRFEGDVKDYLCRAIKNRCLNHLKKQQTKERHQAVFAGMQEETTAIHSEANPDYTLCLRQNLEKMAVQKRAAISMVYIHGKKYQDAADEMGISINSFKTHLKTGLKILRHAIKKDPSV